MKKNRMMRLASILLVCVLLTTSVISGTFAKYTSKATVTDTARVAKWDVQFKVEDDATPHQMAHEETSIVVKLWDHVDGNVDYDGSGSEKVIAPGTTGTFSFSIENKSEVNATYSLDYTVENAGVPIEYRVDGGAWTKDIADVTDATFNMGAAVDVEIEWRWAFTGNLSENYKTEQTDSNDTSLGLAGSAAPEVTIVISATQVD